MIAHATKRFTLIQIIRLRIPGDLLKDAFFTGEMFYWLSIMSPRAALRALSVVLERCEFYSRYAESYYLRTVNARDVDMLRAVCLLLKEVVK